MDLLHQEGTGVGTVPRSMTASCLRPRGIVFGDEYLNATHVIDAYLQYVGEWITRQGTRSPNFVAMGAID